MNPIGTTTTAGTLIPRQSATAATALVTRVPGDTWVKAGNAAAASASPSAGKIGGFFGGLKVNFVSAALAAVVCNFFAYKHGDINLRQLVGVTALDTAVFGSMAGVIGVVLAPLGLGFWGAMGPGIVMGLVGAWAYDKLLRGRFLKAIA